MVGWFLFSFLNENASGKSKSMERQNKGLVDVLLSSTHDKQSSLLGRALLSQHQLKEVWSLESCV